MSDTRQTQPNTRPQARGASPDVGVVSIVIPHLDDYANLDACLTLLGKQTFPIERTEIIVADNGSSRGFDAVRALVGARGRVLEVKERGAGPARNAGVRASRGDVLAFIDSDCRPDERWLEEGLAGLASADFVGGRVDVLVEDPRRMTAVEALESVFAFQNERYVRDRKFTVTASMFVPRSVFDAVGQFENGVPEDIDWCRRANRKGYRIGFAPGSIVGHPARRTMDELKRKWRRLTLEWFAAAQRDGKGRASMLLHEWGVMLTIPPNALALIAASRVGGIRTRMRAIGALFRIRAYRFLIAHRAILGLPQR